MRLLRARWVLPIADRPIPRTWIAIEGGRIAAVGRPDAALPASSGPVEDLGDVAVLPALVNAHAHLELSWLRGRVPPAASFDAWVTAMLAERAATAADDERVGAGIGAAIRELHASGTGLVGDVSNTMATVAPLREGPVGGVVFHELLGFPQARADEVLAAGQRELARWPGDEHVRVSLAPHAPYSVSPALFQGLRRALEHAPFAPTTVHLGESREELRFLRDGTGPLRALLERLGAWDPGWVAPRCGPVEYLDRMRVLGPQVLAVHGTQLDDAALAVLATRGATLVACARSNRWVGAGDPPVARFYASGVRVAVGTDSLASAPDLNLFGELEALRALAPSVPASALLASATREGAAALGFEATDGTIEPGRRARLIAVTVPPHVGDVEEYLVSGIRPDQVRWVEQG